MLWIMIKNNLKMIFRSKFMLVMVLLSPIIVMGALSSAFDGLLQDDYSLETVTIGYHTMEGSVLDRFLSENQKSFEEDKITLRLCETVEGRELVAGKELDVFVLEGEDGLELFTLNPNSIPTEMCQYLLNRFYREYGNAYREAVLTQVTATTGTESELIVDFQTDKLDSLELSPAGNYYGIIETVYFIWFSGMLFLTAVVQSERKNRISQRFLSAPAGSFMIYLSKFLPALLMTVFSTAVSAVVATCLFEVQWKNIAGSMGIFFLAALAGTAFGITVLYLVKNLAVSAILTFSLVWIMGFLGGSFETYMFSSLAENIKGISPLYYVNRTLVEYSTMGHSDYTGKCVLIMLVLFVVFSITGSLLMKNRMEVE